MGIGRRWKSIPKDWRTVIVWTSAFVIPILAAFVAYLVWPTWDKTAVALAHRAAAIEQERPEEALRVYSGIVSDFDPDASHSYRARRAVESARQGIARIEQRFEAAERALEEERQAAEAARRAAANARREREEKAARNREKRRRDDLERASVGGKYTELMKVISAPEDKERRGEFNDWGHSTYRSYKGVKLGRTGYWVYVYPNWYVWSNKAVENEERGDQPNVEAGRYAREKRIFNAWLRSESRAWNEAAKRGLDYEGKERLRKQYYKELLEKFQITEDELTEISALAEREQWPYPESNVSLDGMKFDDPWVPLKPNIEVGGLYRVGRQTPLMRSFPQDRDDVDAIVQEIASVRQIPPNGTIRIMQTKMQMMQGVNSYERAWYKVRARNESGGVVGVGWINSDALIGQTVTRVE